MRFTTYAILAVASLALQAFSLPTTPSNNKVERAAAPADTLDIAWKREASAKDVESRAAEIPPENIPVILYEHTQRNQARQETKEEDLKPVSSSDFNKRNAEPSTSSTGEEHPKLQPRVTTMSPDVGIPPDLTSGLVMFMIVFMFYAMITAISMKDCD